MTPLPPRRILEAVAHYTQTQPGVYVLEVQHDNGCPAISKANDDACARWCKPRYCLHRSTPALVLPYMSQAKVMRGRR